MGDTLLLLPPFCSIKSSSSHHPHHLASLLKDLSLRGSKGLTLSRHLLPSDDPEKGREREDFSQVAHSDRFIVSLNYCHTSFDVQLFFDPESPSSPPDILLDASVSSKGFRLKLGQLSSYLNWDRSNPNCLAEFLEEILLLFRNAERDAIVSIKNNPLQFQLACLAEKEDLEYYHTVDGSSKKVFLSAPLHLTLKSQGPAPQIKLNFEISISSSYEDSTPKIECKSQMDPFWRNALTSFRLKSFETNTLISDYIEEASRNLSKLIDFFYDSQQKRKSFLLTVQNQYAKSLLECDLAGFSISLLFESKNTVWIVKIALPTGFPEERPEISLISFYDPFGLPTAEGVGVPKKKAVNIVKIDPKWNDEELCKRIMDSIFEAMKYF